jgi:hypothetical protein
MTAEFTLTLHSHDSRNSPSADFLDIHAAVACRSFTGQTAFSFSRRDFDSFLTDLAAVQATTRDSALLIGGWDDASERLRLRIAPAGAFGHFLATVRIADTGPRTDQWHRVETEFVATPAALADFVASLQQLAAKRHPGAARLAGDPDAIA